MSTKKSARGSEAVPTPMAELGHEFRRVRKEKNMGLQETADRLGLSFGYLARIERGEQKLTSEQIEAFASIYELPAGDLLERAGLTSSFTQYLPVESIQHCATFVIKHPLMQGGFHVPTTLEGKAMMVCLFQALSNRRLLDEIETMVTLKWLGFASLEDLQFAYLRPPSKSVDVLRRRGSSAESLEDVARVLKSMPSWGMPKWMPREDLPELDDDSQQMAAGVDKGRMAIDNSESRGITSVEAVKNIFEGLSDPELLIQVTKMIHQWRYHFSPEIVHE